MRILEINKFHYSRRGGDKHFMDVIKLLESRGHEVAAFSMHHSKNENSRWNKHFLSYAGYNKNDSTLWQKIKGGLRMFYSFEAKRKINKLLNDFRPDIVHIHNIYHQLSPVILFEIKKRKIPVVMTIHDYKIINPNHGLYLNGHLYNRCKNGKYYQCFLDKCVKNSYFKSFVATLEAYWHNKILKTYQKNVDFYIVPSLFARDVLSEWGVDNKKIVIIPHFVDSKKLSDPENGRPAIKSYALCPGSITKEKGVDLLIGIFKKINGTNLYLAGTIENNFKISESDKIKYLGHLNQNQLISYVSRAKFIISGSRLPETFGLIALEAISQGKPFVGFKTGAYGEIVENGVNGMLVENEEELKETIVKIIKGGLVFNGEKIKNSACQKYSQGNYYQKLMEIFKNALMSGGA